MPRSSTEASVQTTRSAYIAAGRPLRRLCNGPRLRFVPLDGRTRSALPAADRVRARGDATHSGGAPIGSLRLEVGLVCPRAEVLWMRICLVSWRRRVNFRLVVFFWHSHGGTAQTA